MAPRKRRSGVMRRVTTGPTVATLVYGRHPSVPEEVALLEVRGELVCLYGPDGLFDASVSPKALREALLQRSVATVEVVEGGEFLGAPADLGFRALPAGSYALEEFIGAYSEAVGATEPDAFLTEEVVVRRADEPS